METGDFKRFAKGNTYAAFLGLVPGEHSSSTNVNRLGISKAGNTHLRRLLIESAGGICSRNSFLKFFLRYPGNFRIFGI